MWTAVEARRALERPRPTLSFGPHGTPRVAPRRRWMLAAAAVVVLATGIALGWSVRERVGGGAEPSVVTGPSVAAQAQGSVAYQIAVTRDLTQVEALLTAYHTPRTEDHAAADAQLAAWARDLVMNTRLLLDSPAGADPQRRRLLQDLELVLVQIVELGPDHSGTDRDMIDQTLDRNHVLTRLRAAVPPGTTGI
jgi:hypothetical protein